jgi:hypothetical protein
MREWLMDGSWNWNRASGNYGVTTPDWTGFPRISTRFLEGGRGFIDSHRLRLANNLITPYARTEYGVRSYEVR